MDNNTILKFDFFKPFRIFLAYLVPLVVIVVFVTALVLNWQMNKYRTGEVVIDDRIAVDVMVADTPEKRQKGLTVKDSLGGREGMLFEFPHADRYRFWMKDMAFPIDIIWLIDEEIVDFSLNIPPADPSLKVIPGYQPAVPINKVLEVPAGFVAEQGLRLGMTVSYRIDTK
jgi:hypothetical protein